MRDGASRPQTKLRRLISEFCRGAETYRLIGHKVGAGIGPVPVGTAFGAYRSRFLERRRSYRSSRRQPRASEAGVGRTEVKKAEPPVVSLVESGNTEQMTCLFLFLFPTVPWRPFRWTRSRSGLNGNMSPSGTGFAVSFFVTAPM